MLVCTVETTYRLFRLPGQDMGGREGGGQRDLKHAQRRKVQFLIQIYRSEDNTSALHGALPILRQLIVSFDFRVRTWEGGREEGSGISSMRKDAKSSSLSNSPLHAAIVELSTGSDRVIQGCYDYVRSDYDPTKVLT